MHLKTRTARALLEYLTKEIDTAKMCTDCYRNANVCEMGWFTRVCRKPHLIVWTKRCDSNYWPAKVMSTNGEEVMVQFFGNHTTTSVPAASSCFLYSDDNPHHTNVSSYLYKSALKVRIGIFRLFKNFRHSNWDDSIFRSFSNGSLGDKSVHRQRLQTIRII